MSDERFQNEVALTVDHPLFAGMSDEHRALIAECAHPEQYSPDEYLFRMGDHADKSYLIGSGMLSIEVRAGARGIVRVETLGADDVVGFSWIFPPHRWKFDGRAVEFLQVTALDGKRLRELKMADREFGYELMLRYSAVMTDRLHATRLQLMDFYGDHAR